MLLRARRRGLSRGTAVFLVALMLAAMSGGVLGVYIRERVLAQAWTANLQHCRTLVGPERTCCLAGMRAAY